MVQLIKKLTEKRLGYEAELSAVLVDLVDASKPGLGNETYLKLVTNALSLIDQIDEVSFFPKYSGLKKRLTHNQRFAEQALQKQQLAAQESNKQAAPAENQPAIALEEEEKSVNVQPEAKLAYQAELEELEKRFAEAKREDQDFIHYFQEKQNIINHLWNLDLPFDHMSTVSSIVEKERKLEEERIACIKQACRNHDLNTVQGLFDEEKDSSWLDVLIQIIFFYGDDKLFSWIAEKTKCKVSIQVNVEEILLNLQPEHHKIFLNCAKHRNDLILAYEARNFSVFCKLLEMKRNPNVVDTKRTPLWWRCILDKEYHYAEKLLDLRIDPNKKIVLSEQQALADLGKETKGEYLEMPPIAYLVAKRDEEGVNLLLRYDIQLSDAMWFLAITSQNKKRPLNLNIIEEIQRKGNFDINARCYMKEEKGGSESTALDIAVTEKDLQTVGLLLSLGANPLLGSTNTVNGFSTQVSSLLKAAKMGQYDIVTLMVDTMDDAYRKDLPKEIVKILDIHTEDKKLFSILHPHCPKYVPDPNRPIKEVYGAVKSLFETGKTQTQAKDFSAAKLSFERAIDYATECIKAQPPQGYDPRTFQSIQVKLKQLRVEIIAANEQNEKALAAQHAGVRRPVAS